MHLLASRALSPLDYRRVGVGDVNGLGEGLHDMERAVIAERKRIADGSTSVDAISRLVRRIEGFYRTQ